MSRPARQCISVLLPEPDGPMMAVKRPAGSPTVDAVERAHLGAARAVDLDGADSARAASNGGATHVGGGGGARWVAAGCGAAKVSVSMRPS